MRISYYIDTIIPAQNASTVHVMRMCQALTKMGHTVSLFCNTDSKTPQLEAIWKHYGTNNRFFIRQIYLPKFLIKHGHRFTNYYSAWKKAREETECDCIYSRSAASLYFLKDRYPYFFEAHASPDVINIHIERTILKHSNCKGLVVISQALKDEYLRLFPFLSAEKITVLHDAADIEQVTVNAIAQLDGVPGSIRIGYLGHLFPGKCMETVIPLAKRCPEYQIHIVGGTTYWVDYWKEKAREAKVDNLFFYGYVDNADVAKYYQAFDICLLPFSKKIFISKNKRVDIGKWTSPLKLFESMAHAKPILVSRIPTIEEVMEDGVDCVMADPEDIDDWAEKLSMLCNDKKLQSKIASAARKKLEQKYTWGIRAQKVTELIQNNLNNS